jgi:hypothetical protein
MKSRSSGHQSAQTIAVHINIGTNVVGLTCWSASYNGGAATPPYHAEMIRPANVIVISHKQVAQPSPQAALE